jgi:hypothetical protein
LACAYVAAGVASATGLLVTTPSAPSPRTQYGLGRPSCFPRTASGP